MNVAIISYGVLPVPAVKGGAVENLIDHLLNENEIRKKLNIIVYSVLDENAQERSKYYNNTKFKYIKVNRQLEKIYLFLCRVMKKFFKIDLIKEKIYLKKVIDDIKSNTYDKIIIENNANFVTAVKKNTSSQVYLHLHNDYLNCNVNDCVKIYNSCEKIIVVSDYIKKCVETIKKEKLKINVLKNCIDINTFNNSNYEEKGSNFKEKLNINTNDVVVMYSGRITQTKGVRELLLAFKKASVDKNIKLLIVGSAWYSANIKDEYMLELQKISEDIKEKIVFTGYINYEDMPRIHAISDIAIIPSVWDEPAGLVVIEAMSSGLPIIATNSGGIPEYICKQGCILVERDLNLINNMSDKIEELYYDKKKRIEMGLINQRFSLHYNTEDYYNEFIRIIE